jgi:hypothetical protein
MKRIALGALLVAVLASALQVSPGAVAETVTKAVNPVAVAKKFAKKYAQQFAKKYSTPGPAGPAGSTGPPGPPGVFSASNVTQVAGPSATTCPTGGGACSVGSSVATCPTGGVILGGGWDGENEPPVRATTGYDKPISASWEVIMTNTGSVEQKFHAVATCAVPASAQPKRAAKPSAEVQTQVGEDLRAARAAAAR